MELGFVNSIKALLHKVNHVAIVSHYNPDGDAVGSCLGLYNYLLNKVSEITVILPNDFPDFLRWMDGAENIKIYTQQETAIEEVLNKVDVIFCLDFNNFARVSKMESVLKNSPAKKVLIDHHVQPETNSFDYVNSIINVSSTSEIVFELIKNLKTPEETITAEVAACIYAGIITDTGSFSYSCNYSATHRVVAELIECGINTEDIHRLIYDTYSEPRLRLLGFCLAERMIVNRELHTAYIYLYKKDLYKYKYKIGDLEGVVNYTLAMEGINFGALFTEREDRIRISFRSKKRFDVNSFAREHFNGGGHKNASGGNTFDTLENTIKKFEVLLPYYRTELEES